MGTRHAIDEADIRRRVEAGVAAVRAMDLEGIMALYAPDNGGDIGSSVAGTTKWKPARRRRPAPADELRLLHHGG